MALASTGRLARTLGDKMNNCDLSPDEERSLKKLRRAEAAWRTNRWLLLLVGAAMLIFALYGRQNAGEAMLELAKMGPDRVTPVLFVLVARNDALFRGMTVLAVAVVAFVLANWRGQPVRTLLLHLFEERQDGRQQ